MTDNRNNNNNTLAKNNNKGIDFRQALEILASRSTQQGHHHHQHSHDACCQHYSREAPPNARTMGQRIDLLPDDTSSTSTTTTANDKNAEELQRQVQEERARRKNEIDKALQSMSVRELLQSVMEAQQRRVETYRNYDRGLEEVLETGNMSLYPTVCAEATASFSVLSDTINSVQQVLLEKHRRRDLSDTIVQLQAREQNKLNVTAALHLERIRERTHMLSTDGGQDQISSLLREGVVSLREKVNVSIGDINEILDELRCSVAEEEE